MQTGYIHIHSINRNDFQDDIDETKPLHKSKEKNTEISPPRNNTSKYMMTIIQVYIVNLVSSIVNQWDFLLNKLIV